jgi:hypothetical protein
MEISELVIAMPHGDRASGAFAEWLIERPRHAVSLGHALQQWLSEDGAGAEDSGYDYETWLEVVIYIIVCWTDDPDRYPRREVNGTTAAFQSIVAESGLEGVPWSFLSRGFYALMSVDGQLFRRAQAIRQGHEA